MPAYICLTCGVQHADRGAPPTSCPICDDERQYVGWNGQQWTTLPEMVASGYRNVLREEDSGLTSITTVSPFGIGQQALLVQTPAGNVLWDCISLLDDATIAALRARGGIRAIAISHPHFYATCVEWSDAFGGVPNVECVLACAEHTRQCERGLLEIVLFAGQVSDAEIKFVHFACCVCERPLNCLCESFGAQRLTRV